MFVVNAFRKTGFKINLEEYFSTIHLGKYIFYFISHKQTKKGSEQAKKKK